MRMRTRLSHCEMTFSCAFCGRWVETRSTRPNLRPSPAIRTACSVAIAVSGSSGTCGHTLWASSITIRIGSRAARRLQSAASTASAATACSARVPSEPRSTTTQRGPPGATALRASRRRAQTRPASCRCRGFRARTPRECSGSGCAHMRSIVSRTLSARSASAFSSASASAAYSSRSAIGSRRSTRPVGRVEVAEADVEAVSARHRRRAARAPRPRPPCTGRGHPWARRRAARARRTKSEFGSRITMRSNVSMRRRSRIVPSAYVLPEPDWPQRKDAGRSRPRPC